MTRQLVSLFAGLSLFGFSIGLMLNSGLGLSPWDVLHQGIAIKTGIPIGLVVMAVAVLVLALWWPLRQRPGIGTIANVFVVGLTVQASIAILPEPRHLAWRLTLLLLGILLNGVATGLYLGARLGPGARDGLMTGLASRGLSIRVARTGVEVTVLAAGWLLGGTVGLGTLLYAVTIGPLAHYFIPKLAIPAPTPIRQPS
jgi:uncharacterized membrane protein YczE